MAGVKLLDPLGREFDFPEENVESALKDGFTLPTAAPVEQAQPDVAAPATVPDPPVKMVKLVDPMGRSFDFPEGNVEAALNDGFSLPKVELSGLEKAQTAIEGASTGALFGGAETPLQALQGLGTYGASKLAGAIHGIPGPGPDLQASLEQARADMARRQEAAPVLSGASKIVGGVAGGLATSSAFAMNAIAERAAIATASKIGIPIVAGADAAAKAAAIAKASTLKRAVVNVARAMIPSMVEGGVYMSASEADEAMQAAYAVDGEIDRGDWNSVAEAGAHGLGMGAAWGAAGAVAIPAAGAIVSAGANKAGSIFARNQTAEQFAQDPVIDTLQEAIERTEYVSKEALKEVDDSRKYIGEAAQEVAGPVVPAAIRDAEGNVVMPPDEVVEQVVPQPGYAPGYGDIDASSAPAVGFSKKQLANLARHSEMEPPEKLRRFRQGSFGTAGPRPDLDLPTGKKLRVGDKYSGATVDDSQRLNELELPEAPAIREDGYGLPLEDATPAYREADVGEAGHPVDIDTLPYHQGGEVERLERTGNVATTPVMKDEHGNLFQADSAPPIPEHAFNDGREDSVDFDPEKLVLDWGPLHAVDMPGPQVSRAQAAARAMAADGHYDDLKENAIRSITDKLKRFADIAGKSRVENSISSKYRWAQEKFNTYVPSKPHPEVMALFDSNIDKLARMSQGSTYALRKFGGQAKTKVMVQALTEYRDQYAQYMARGLQGDAANTLDTVKRNLGEFSNTNNDALEYLIRGETGEDGVYGDWKRLLENEQIFGAYAKQQKPANRMTYLAIQAKADAHIKGLFIDEGVPGAHTWDNAKKPDGKWVGNLVRAIEDPEKFQQEAAFKRFLRATANDVAGRSAWIDDPELKQNAIEMSKLVSEIEDSYNAVHRTWFEAKSIRDKVKHAAELPVPGEILPKAVRGAAKVGAMIAKQIVPKADQADRVAVAAVQQHMTVVRAAEDMAKAVTSQAVPTAKPKKALEKATQAVAIAASLQALVQSYRHDSVESRERFARARDLPPDLAGPALAHEKAKRDFVARKAGQGSARDSLSEIKLRRALQAVDRPDGAIERISALRETPEDVEAMWEVYPSQMAKLRDATMRNIVESGIKPSRYMRSALQRVFKMPDSEYMMFLGEANKTSAQPVDKSGLSPAQGKPLAMPNSGTEADRLMR